MSIDVIIAFLTMLVDALPEIGIFITAWISFLAYLQTLFGGL